jgi:hypothetical protein
MSFTFSRTQAGEEGQDFMTPSGLKNSGKLQPLGWLNKATGGFKESEGISEREKT